MRDWKLGTRTSSTALSVSEPTEVISVSSHGGEECVRPCELVVIHV
jgi:hypothetical protein